MRKLLLTAAFALSATVGMINPASATTDSYTTVNISGTNITPAPQYKFFTTQRWDAFNNDSIPVSVTWVAPGTGLGIYTYSCTSTTRTSNIVVINSGQAATMNMVSSNGCFRLAMTVTGTAQLADMAGTLRYQI